MGSTEPQSDLFMHLFNIFLQAVIVFYVLGERKLESHNVLIRRMEHSICIVL